jgi:hypothetical protein
MLGFERVDYAAQHDSEGALSRMSARKPFSSKPKFP